MPSTAEKVAKYFEDVRNVFDRDAAQVRSPEHAEAFRLKWIGREKGFTRFLSLVLKAQNWQELNEMAGIVGGLESITFAASDPDIRRSWGMHLNPFVAYAKDVIESFATRERTAEAAAAPIDITLPGSTRTPGIPHPLVETMRAVVKVFEQLGYSVNLGPEVETDFYNFEALNFPPNHPARDTQDTLLIAHQQAKPSRDRLLMRTHTSPVQIRTMVEHAPPIRIVIPGKVHRNDAADATHSPIFHQVEGLCVDAAITFSDLKGTLDHAMKALFGHDVKTRFFPSFFPFTEPSADVQISCIFCGGAGCRKCKHSGWIELLGCGMVDPAVFAQVTSERKRLGLDPTPYDPAHISGFAFGMGVERIAMILHGVSDIGNFYSGDLRFLEQFA
ncbi:MAG: phenylalanine--tRNA ligase subunit alpha [Acidobacteriaceae bacterium]